jgi:alpha-L-fucosidase
MVVSIRAQNASVGGQPPGILTPTNSIRRPEVAVPVVELFLSEPQVP